MSITVKPFPAYAHLAY